MKSRLKDVARSAPTPAFLIAAVLLGGASGARAGSIANAVLQLISLGIILFCLWADRRTRLPVEARLLLSIGLAFVLIVLLTLAPLPAGIWQGLPGREIVRTGFGQIGGAVPSFSVSLAPQRSIDSLLWVLPPFAAFLLALRASDRARKTLPIAVLLITILTVGLGVAQLVSGPTALRPYQVTNPGRAVGMFANANHFATLILCALPFSGYLAARSVRRQSGSKRVSGLAVAGATALLLTIGVAVVGSAAGLGLLLVIGAATALIYRKAAVGRLNAVWIGAVAILFAALVAVAFAGPFQGEALSGKLNDQRTSRKVMGQTTIEGIKATFPVGTGLGTFPAFYRTLEDERVFGVELVNHAHDDYLEVALELGLAGILVVLGFIVWWAVQSVRVWRSSVQGSDLARVGSVIVLVVLLHSLVDYPIRTSAIASLVAVGCALMIPPSRSERPLRRRRGSREGAGLTHLEAD